MSKGFKNYLFAMLLPLAVLFSMTLLPIFTLYAGEEISLKTRPVDPRDLFRGDYVILDYEINEIVPEKMDEEAQKILKSDQSYDLYGKDVYVVLKKGKTYHEVDYAAFKKPVGKLYLKGKIDYIRTQNIATEREKVVSVIVSYNLDKYFVPENTGLKLEELSRQGQLAVKVKVLNGYPVLIDVFSE